METDQQQQQPQSDEPATGAGSVDSRAGGAPSQAPTAASSSGGGGAGPVAKCVYIFRNGDVFAPSKKFVLNRRQLRDWDVFLEQVTMSVNPLRGAVRTIVTPKRGRRRIQDLDSFDDKGFYVALSKGEKFKPVTYIPDGEISGGDHGTPGEHLDANGAQSPVGSPRRPPAGGNRIVLEPILPVVHNKKLMSVQPRFGAKMEVISSQSKVIRVYRNGDEFTPAIITMLRPSEQVGMEFVLRAIEEKVVLPNNMAIRKLYDLSGHRIREPSELQHEKFYVAGGHEAFMPRPYGQKLPVIVIGKAERTEGSAWSAIKYLSQPITPDKNSTRRSKADPQQPQQQQQQQPAGTKTGGGGGGGDRGGGGAANKANPHAKPDPSKTLKKQQQQHSRQEVEHSASVIQSGIRGFQTRIKVASQLAQRPIDVGKTNSMQKKKPFTVEQVAAARTIQASVNSYKTRKEVAKQQAAKKP